MTISEEAKAVIGQEQQILSDVLASLEEQKGHKLGRLRIEEIRSRELTSEIVRTHRDEEKALLASDEAVSHGIKDRQKVDVATIDRLVKQPYFARVILKESSHGQEKEIEYKIGIAENADCRIIDWRKAPIARLYYEYKEGEEYSEEIQGRERNGKVALRNQLEIANSKLVGVACRQGNFIRHGEEWESAQGSLRPVSSEEAAANALPQIAALLDAQQFNLISDSGDQALLVQGVAGSGKTTVALHRLAWLAADPARQLRPDRSLVLVLSKSLKIYISKTLPDLGVTGVPVYSVPEWFDRVLSKAIPHLALPCAEGELPALRRPATPCPAAIDRLFRSMALLRAAEEWVQNQRKEHISTLGLDAALLSIIRSSTRIVELDETRLIDDKLVRAGHDRLAACLTERSIDRAVDPILTRLCLLIRNGLPQIDGTTGRYDHVFADEVQDLGPTELACVLESAARREAVTIVGDTAQKIDEHSTFLGWDKLRKFWSGKESISRFVNLNLSYRSTVEIQRFADFIRGERGTSNEGRHGRPPIWFKCLSEQRGIDSARSWLTRAVEKYPAKLSAVVCRDPIQSRHVLTLLRPAFGVAVRAGDETGFSFEGGIVVTHAAAVRGMEFTNVLLWNPSRRDYPADSTHRNLMYVAASRARENLCIVSWGKASDLLPAFGSKLVRGMDIEREEREQMEEEKRVQND